MFIYILFCFRTFEYHSGQLVFLVSGIYRIKKSKVSPGLYQIQSTDGSRIRQVVAASQLLPVNIKDLLQDARRLLNEQEKVKSELKANHEREMAAARSSFQQQKTELEDAIASSKSELDRKGKLERIVHSTKSELEESKKRISSLLSEGNSLLENFRALQKQHKQCAARDKDAVEEIKTLLAQLQESNNSKEEVQAELERAELEIKQVLSDRDELDAELETKNQRILSQEKEIDRLNLDVAALENKRLSLFERLNLHSSCSVDDVKSAYRYLSLVLHPDKRGCGKPPFDSGDKFADEEAAEKYKFYNDRFSLLHEAYILLTNEHVLNFYRVTLNLDRAKTMYQRRTQSS